MSSPLIGNLLKLVDAGKESALLRFSLGSEYLKSGQPALATRQLQRAVELDPHYSAAWKLLGKSLHDEGDLLMALAAYRRGIEVAQQRGDKQVQREMMVFVRRIEKQLGDPA